jgi:hypothetical protein
VHKHHANAPRGGTFTAVIYKTDLAVDWTFISESIATRNEQTKLLFERLPIPISVRSVEINELERISRLEERYLFFWLLTVPAARVWRRQEGIKFLSVLEMMYAAVSDIEHLLAGDLPGGGEDGGTNTGHRRRHS